MTITVNLGFISTDQMWWKYPHLSSYNYCGNNPIMRIDPTGMIWDDPEEAQKLADNTTAKIKTLTETKSAIQSQIDNGELNETDAATAAGRVSEFTNRIYKLEQSVKDIAKLGADQSNIYVLDRLENSEHHRVRCGSDGKVYIENFSDASALHEISHVRQSLDAGGLDFKGELLLNAGKETRVQLRNEVEAYQIQYSLDLSFPGLLRARGMGSGLNGINVYSVGNIMDSRGKPAYEEFYRYINGGNKK